MTINHRYAFEPDRLCRAIDAVRPQAAMPARNSDTRTSYPASEIPRKRQAASSQRTILMF
jgi:hypothetical protein